MHKRLMKALLVVIISSVLGGGLLLGCTQVNSKQQTPQQSPFAQPADNNQISDARNTPIVRAVRAVGPAVVGITNKAYARDLLRGKVLVEKGSGSGVIIDQNGIIVTNNHVVEDAQELIVSLSDGRSFSGKVLGRDPMTDLAVIKVEATGLPAAVLGDSDNLMVGETAIAIGNPLGREFQGSVTVGVVSALGRSIEIGDRQFKLIQTDAAINPGNSGGALASADGAVIGINSAKVSLEGVEGIAFAIPINSAKPIIQSIIEKGRVIRSYLGVGLIDKRTAPNFDIDLEKGVLIAQIYANGPAAKAGLSEDDVILSIGDKEVNTVVDLRTELDKYAVGTKVDVVILRDNKQITVGVVLEETPQKQPRMRR